MTGYGEAHRHEDGLAVAVEVRTINNRYFKLNLRMTEGYAAARAAGRSARPRSTSAAAPSRSTLRVDREPTGRRLSAQRVVLVGYLKQLEAACGNAWQSAMPVGSIRCWRCPASSTSRAAELDAVERTGR